MGSVVCKVFKRKPVKVLFYGVHASGKTTLLYRLKEGEAVSTVPTMGFNVEELDINGINVTAWDVTVGDTMRPFIRQYMDGTHAVIFMVDSSDRERLTDALEDFFSFINETVQEKQLPVLVLANKQDRSEVMSPEKIKTAIYEKGGTAFRINTALEAFPTVALTLEGVTPALEWLCSQLTLKMIHNGYAPFWTKATYYSTSVMKSTYSRVTGLLSSADNEKKEDLSEEPVAEKDIASYCSEGKG